MLLNGALAGMSNDVAVLVTGSAGDVGQALVRAFSDAGYFVIGLDLDSTAKCNTTKRLEVRCASIGTLTTTLELHDELYAPHRRRTLPDSRHVGC